MRDTHFVKGALCWLIGEEFRVLSPRLCQELALTDRPGYDAAIQQARYEAYVAKSIEAYRQRRKGREYTPEELFEMRAAFGPGATVVDVLTGKRTKL